jgi:hypothetical protein
MPPARCLPCLPLLGLRIVSWASVSPRLHQHPNTRWKCPGSATDLFEFRSILAVPLGSQAVRPLLARRRLRGRKYPCLSGRAFPQRPLPNRLLEPARPTSKRASLEPWPAVRVPAPEPRSRRQAAGLRVRQPSLPDGPAPRKIALHCAAGFARGRSRPRPGPPPQGASSTCGDRPTKSPLPPLAGRSPRRHPGHG